MAVIPLRPSSRALDTVNAPMLRRASSKGRGFVAIQHLPLIVNLDAPTSDLTQASFPRHSVHSGAASSAGCEAISATPVLSSAVAGAGLQRHEAADQLRNVGQLETAADYAALCGQCYMPEEQQSSFLAKQGLALIARGSTAFTRWYIADRKLPESRAGPEMERMIIMRGVSWRGGGPDNFRIWRELTRVWPQAFEADAVSPKGCLLAHAGVQSMAEELWRELSPHMTPDVQLTLAGHSLGGSLAVLLTCMARLRLGIPGAQLRCLAFGSPPVLSLLTSMGCTDVLQAVGLPPGSMNSYVLDNDPIPRALLSVDPTFEWLRRWGPVGRALNAGTSWLGWPTLSPSPALLHNAGSIFLVKWSADQGHQVMRLGAEELGELVVSAVNTAAMQPAAMLQAFMDHSHASYAADLRAAAAQLIGGSRAHTSRASLS